MREGDIERARLNEILVRVEELARLANDPEEFSRLRREIIDAYIGRMEPSRARQNRAMQDEIELTCAVSGSPGRSAMHLLEMGNDRIIAIDNLRRVLTGKQTCE